jgi:hypothetical protein
MWGRLTDWKAGAASAALMTVTGIAYSSAERVNGFLCRNCSDVDLAKKNIDPAHPKSGPNNRDAASDPTRIGTDPAKIAAARAAAATALTTVVGYSSTGYRTASVTAGTGFSLTA